MAAPRVKDVGYVAQYGEVENVVYHATVNAIGDADYTAIINIKNRVEAQFNFQVIDDMAFDMNEQLMEDINTPE